MKAYKSLTKEEKLACISLYLEDAKKDEDGDIRQEAYRSLGFTEEAKKDENCNIRLEAYHSLGFTENAKKDEDSDIRQEAELYFKVLNEK